MGFKNDATSRTFEFEDILALRSELVVNGVQAELACDRAVSVLALETHEPVFPFDVLHAPSDEALGQVWEFAEKEDLKSDDQDVNEQQDIDGDKHSSLSAHDTNPVTRFRIRVNYSVVCCLSKLMSEPGKW